MELNYEFPPFTSLQFRSPPLQIRSLVGVGVWQHGFSLTCCRAKELGQPQVVVSSAGSKPPPAACASNWAGWGDHDGQARRVPGRWPC